MTPDIVKQWQEELHGATARNVIRWAIKQFGQDLVQASGFGAEDQVITHILADNAPGARAVFVDTGRHFQQTHELLAQTAEYYDIDIRIHMPDGKTLETLIGEHGANLFHKSLTLRRQCCAVRKHQPLARALAPYQAWLSGRRRQQGDRKVEVISWDEGHQMVRIDPLWNWHEKQLWDYVRLHQIPHHELHAQGYAFPGCAPCTRPIKPGEASDSGRWWWEERQEHREVVMLRV